MMKRWIRRFQQLEERRLLAVDAGWAPLDQVATHVQLDATLGQIGGNLVPTQDQMFDQLFEVPRQHGDFSLGEAARSTRVADVNGDGLSDVVSLSYTTLMTQLQQPDGSLGPRMYSQLGDFSPFDSCVNEDFSLADTNGDSASEAVFSCLDEVLVMEFDAQSGFDRVLYESEELRFSADMAASSDLNGDGIADFVFVSHQRHRETRVLLGTGTGTLVPQQTMQTNDLFVRHFFLGDVDDDSKDDLLFILDDTDQVLVQRGVGDGTFGDLEPLVGIDSNRGYHSIAAADINGDGTTDLITSDYHRQINVWYQESFGYRLETIAMPDYVLDLEVSEAATDGGPLVYVMLQNTSDFPTRRIDLLQIVDESSVNRLDTINVPDGSGLRLADLNHDSIDDVVIQHATVASVVHVDDSFHFSQIREVTLFDSPSPISQIAADFDGDGVEDVVYFHRRADHFSLIKGARGLEDSSQIAVTRHDLPGSLAIGKAFATDFNSDGFVDLIGVPEDGAATVVRMAGRGDGTFAPPEPLLLDSAGTLDGIVIDDITGDGNVDLGAITELAGDTRWQIWRGDGTGNFIRESNQSVISSRTLFASERLHDGRLLMSVHADGAVRSTRIEADGSIATSEILFTVDSPEEIRRFLAVNLNGDESADVVVSRGVFNSPQEVYVSDAVGGYDLVELDLEGYAVRLSADDSSGDGIDEVLVEGDRSTLLVYALDGTVVIDPVQRDGRWRRTSAAVRSDLNGDGRQDLIYLESGIGVFWGRSRDDGSSLALSPWLVRDRVNYFDVDVRGVDGVDLFVSAWIDFNQDGTWSDGEQVVHGASVGEFDRQLFEFDVPQDAVLGKTWARIRLSDSADVGVDGTALDGEVEDYPVEIVDFGLMDFGDAPADFQSDLLSSYPTRLVDNGARHITGGPRMSNLVDPEEDATPDWIAGSEERSDGNAVRTSFAAGGASVLEVPIRGESGFVNAWLDFNRDGDWDDPGEQIVRGHWLELRSWESVAEHSIPVVIPETVGGQITFLRTRVSTERELGPVGVAPDGEVIDTAVFVTESPSPSTPKLVIGTAGHALSTDNPQSSTRFAVHLSSQPDSDHTVHVSHSFQDTLSVSHQTLVFDSENWSDPQFVTVHQIASADQAGGAELSLVAVDEGGQIVDSENIEVYRAAIQGSRTSQSQLTLAAGETLVAGPRWATGTLVWVDDGWNRQIVRGADRVIVGGESLWQNPIDRYDVDRSASVSPLDALNVINEIARRGDHELPLGTPSEIQQTSPVYFDVSGDSMLSPIDALMVINHLGRQVVGGEAESVRHRDGFSGSDAGGLMDWLEIETRKRDRSEQVIDLAIAGLF
ncbi:FG-GAP-like repeat-containing protein [Rhodopirellula sp. JC639]|uniref:FG-GAP-like repeat-containing protein n=1 Tax=Stieleria mannarensis TaxID=2755585 RepID=UPI001603C690|nr:FG-GAP-like repeat-containing protein [Rhodopirellula sp. JC639]